MKDKNDPFFYSRDLPRFGVKQWQAQFIKTFDIYTKVKLYVILLLCTIYFNYLNLIASFYDEDPES